MDDDRYNRVEHWQDSRGRAKNLGEVWTLQKGARVARCVLQGHPIGSEARVLIDDSVHRTEAFRDSKSMIDATWEWRRAFEAKGWTAPPPYLISNIF